MKIGSLEPVVAVLICLAAYNVVSGVSVTFCETGSGGGTFCKNGTCYSQCPDDCE